MCLAGPPTTFVRSWTLILFECLQYREIVDEVVSMRYLALCHAWRAIHMCSTILVQAMPMYASRFVAELIAYCNDETFALGDMEGRNRPFAIDAHDRSIVQAIGVAVDPRDVELVMCDLGTGETKGQGRQSPECSKHHAQWCCKLGRLSGRAVEGRCTFVEAGHDEPTGAACEKASGMYVGHS